jgi:hypothetical protein
VNDTVNGLPLPVLALAVIVGFIGLLMLVDLDRTRDTTIAGWTFVALSASCLAFAVLVAVAS